MSGIKNGIWSDLMNAFTFPMQLKKLPLLWLMILPVAGAHAQLQVTNDIALNQVGFYPNGTKIAVVKGGAYQDFFVATPDLSEKVFSSRLSETRQSIFSDKKTQVADFSSLTRPGRFVLVVPGLGYSCTFEIRTRIFEDIARASLKAFYYQRFSMELKEEFAGKWKRPFSHPDTRVLIHGSAAGENRKEGTIISTPRGWIDAGDYNKYIVNSGITMGTLLSAYEDFPLFYQRQDLNIPESSDAVPDILDEVVWNLRWMMTMQDPGDGGVYHKCTNAGFDPMIMPHLAVTPRYVVQKGTAAALDFAAVTAQASRIFRKFPRQFPRLADSLITASVMAWNWAVLHPQTAYDQGKVNQKYDPDITTGAYGDNSFKDEFIWAACELLATTKDLRYLEAVNILPDDSMPVPSWSQVKLLGYYSLLRMEKTLPAGLDVSLVTIRKQLIDKADNLTTGVDERAYNTVMGSAAKDFVWGSSAVAANQAIVLINAFKVSGNRKYLKYALHNLDYLLGRNATGYSFLTGFGSRTPMHIHHRPSEADGISEPVPGLLAGGPNPERQDKCTYPSVIPDEAYVDDVCSYASNEVAINWNAPLVYLSGALEALLGE